MKLRRRTPLVAGVPLVAATVLAGCGVTRDGALHPSVNDCVAALPAGIATVGGQARLVKLRRLSLPDTQALLQRLGAAPLTPADRSTPTPAPSSPPAPRPCVLVYQGHFTSGALAGAPHVSGSVGGFVVLVTTTRHPRVLRTVITGTDPVE